MPNYRRVFAAGYSYFITVVTYKRQPLLIENIDLLRQVFAESKQFYRYTIVAIVVLPDHFHMIIEPEDPLAYPKIVSYIKRKFSYLLNQKTPSNSANSLSREKKRESNIWQRRFYEHTIRDEKDFARHFDYIHYNPIKHRHTKEVKEWQYSSFHKFVRLGWYDALWCNFPDTLDLGE